MLRIILGFVDYSFKLRIVNCLLNGEGKKIIIFCNVKNLN